MSHFLDTEMFNLVKFLGDSRLHLTWKNLIVPIKTELVFIVMKTRNRNALKI